MKKLYFVIFSVFFNDKNISKMWLDKELKSLLFKGNLLLKIFMCINAHNTVGDQKYPRESWRTQIKLYSTYSYCTILTP